MSNHSAEDESRTYQELRQLLLGPELKKLEKLTERLDNPDHFSSDIGKALPEAMKKSAAQGEQLSEAMVPTVEEIVRLSIKRDINKFANALFPVIGPAIRKSISETIRQMLQSLNQILEHGLSWKGIKWRIESIRTGIPFAQIVMLNSLEYRVEQVFLIHRETGLLLNHVEQQDSLNQNADMVSSMLTAIGDFIGDSFDVDKRQQLDSIQVGDFSILIEQGPGVILAVASRGNAPSSLRNTMLQVVEDIQSQFDSELVDFKGDTDPFESCRGQLLLCLVQSQHKKTHAKVSLKAKLTWTVVLILLCYWLISKIYLSIQQQDYVNLLEQEAGYIITQVSYEGDRLNIRGLRDPLARDPEKFIALSVLNPDTVNLQFDTFHSLDTPFVEKRLHKILKLPPNVSMDLQSGTLAFSGFASQQTINAINMMAPLIAGINQINISGLNNSIDLTPLNTPDSVDLLLDIDSGHLSSKGTALTSWAEFARKQITNIDGIQSYDDSLLKIELDLSVFNPPETVTLTLLNKTLTVTGIADTDWINTLKNNSNDYEEIYKLDLNGLINSDQQQLDTDIQSLQNEIIFFDAALSFDFSSNESFDHTVVLSKRIIEYAKKLSHTVQIIVTGYSDSVGKFEDNVQLSLERADYVTQNLFNSGISPKYISMKGLESPVIKEKNTAEQRYNRRVTFTVKLNP